MAEPVAMRWRDGALVPVNAEQAKRAAQWNDGEIHVVDEWEPRDWNSHRHFFAQLKDMWASLPDRLTEATFRTPEHLRKKALIATGWSTRIDIVCETDAHALAAMASLQMIDEYAIVKVKGNVVIVWRAKSQSEIGMPDRKNFQRSKWDVLNWVADLLALPPEAEQRMVNE